jgi:hypothetical protein
LKTYRAFKMELRGQEAAMKRDAAQQEMRSSSQPCNGPPPT